MKHFKFEYLFAFWNTWRGAKKKRTETKTKHILKSNFYRNFIRKIAEIRNFSNNLTRYKCKHREPFENSTLHLLEGGQTIFFTKELSWNVTCWILISKLCRGKRSMAFLQELYWILSTGTEVCFGKTFRRKLGLCDREFNRGFRKVERLF